MVINLKNETEAYRYGIYHLLKMIFPYDTVVVNGENADAELSYTVGENTVTVCFDGKLWEEPILREDVLLTLKRTVYRVTDAKLPFGVLTGVRPSQTALKFRQDIVKHLGEVYFVSPKKAEVMEQCAGRVHSVRQSLFRGSVSLYIHIPFCPSRCKYCSFTLAYLKPYSQLIDGYLEALLTELRGVLETISECGLKLTSVYIGGGTPTVLTEAQLERLLQTLNAFSMPQEFTVEAGRADTVTEAKLRLLKEYGVSRVSINPQTLNQKTLETIGRRHTVEEFYRAYEICRKIGFETINTDLIAGLTGETFLDFKHSLDGVISLAPEHITVHTLCKKRTSGLIDTSDRTTAEEVEKMWEYAYQMLLPVYEPYYIYRQKEAVSSMENVGFMKNGKECMYNIFMMEEASSVIAVGAGGTSKLIDFTDKKPFAKLRTDKQPERYIRDLDLTLPKKQAFIRENCHRI
ncbi:MAG: coproporphyrinogen dehydrogenase HemZ [Clostridia bacterium]|nr:coproporphyrinogen dehydrogenase HemZ [Clostridia bacterium]